MLGACAAKPVVSAESPKKASPAVAKASNPAVAQLPLAAARMQEPGPEARQLMRRVGRWDVVATFRADPRAEPVITRGLMADREMVGLYLQETMRPAPGSGVADFRRICYLTYSRVEGRWQFASLDTRMPVGIMPAFSFDKGSETKLTLLFESLAFVGMGPTVEGRMVRSSYVITRDGDDRDLAEQYWVQADGSDSQWLAVQYRYTRQAAAASH
jgi:hypothetical protein